jgi:hypothetical protein
MAEKGSDLVRKICRERGLALSKVERDLDFSNGYLASVKDLRADRALQLADYLGVPVEYIITGEKREPADEMEEYLEILKRRPEGKILLKSLDGAKKEDADVAVAVFEAAVKAQRGEK